MYLATKGDPDATCCGQVFQSTDFGATWATVEPDPITAEDEWQAIASSTDGQHVIVCSYLRVRARMARRARRDVYGLCGGGGSTHFTFSAPLFLPILSSHRPSLHHQYCFVSRNAGTSWKKATVPLGAQAWYAATMSGDGSKI